VLVDDLWVLRLDDICILGFAALVDLDICGSWLVLCGLVFSWDFAGWSV